MARDSSERDEALPPNDDTSGDIQPYIDAYVERMKQSGTIHSAAVERVFRSVPRHRFVPSFYTGQGNDRTHVEIDLAKPDPQHLETIYSDIHLVTRLRDGIPTSSSSQPGLMAGMLDLLELDRGMKVLEIGAGTGYNAALMAEMVGDQALVTTVDVQPDVVTQTQDLLARAGYGGIRVLCADGFYGVPESAPYDRVIVTVGTPDVSQHWVEQLNPSGLILLPLRHAGANPLVLVSRDGETIRGQIVSMSGFMAIQGELHDDTRWGLPIPQTDQPTEQFPVWPDLYPTGALQGPYWELSTWGFWFYLGVRDRRAWLTNWMPSFGLADPHSGHWVNVDREHITLAGDRALLDQLAAYHDEWRDLGSPRIPDFTMRFVPISDVGIGVSDQRRWVVEGRYYARVFSLE